MKNIIQNKKKLSTTPLRKILLDIAEAGLEAIDTENVLRNKLRLEGEILYIEEKKFDLSKFENIYLFGFGKSACSAAVKLEEILGGRISGGAVVGLEEKVCQNVELFVGTHPTPSEANVVASKKIIEYAAKLTDKDLALVIVSGGGSSLLCYPQEECNQSERLYGEFLPTGGTIHELNTVRKHLSKLKGGGLAKTLHPATVVSLIFSDVPGNHPDMVASGPTFKDKTTAEDAQKVLNKYELGDYTLIETPKEDRYFNKVKNITLVSNELALDAMKKKSENLGFTAKIVSAELYDFPNEVIRKMKDSDSQVVLAGGETKLIVNKPGGKGGRNQYLTLTSIRDVGEGEIFSSIASDGMDNGEVAGAIADVDTRNAMLEARINIDHHLDNFDTYTPFQKTGSQILTGPTGSNVSDLMIYIHNLD